jgi:hypothetical protein
VQAILASRRDAMAKVGERRRGYLFADLARCGDCGERFQYAPIVYAAVSESLPWAVLGSNQRPCGCEPHALTS